MAAKLEMLVNNRAGTKGGKMQLLDSSSSIYKKEENEKKLEMESRESLGAYKEFFLNLEAVLSTEDHEESFQYLNQARDIAEELISREENGAPQSKIVRVHAP